MAKANPYLNYPVEILRNELRKENTPDKPAFSDKRAWLRQALSKHLGIKTIGGYDNVLLGEVSPTPYELGYWVYEYYSVDTKQTGYAPNCNKMTMLYNVDENGRVIPVGRVGDKDWTLRYTPTHRGWLPPIEVLNMFIGEEFI